MQKRKDRVILLNQGYSEYKIVSQSDCSVEPAIILQHYIEQIGSCKIDIVATPKAAHNIFLFVETERGGAEGDKTGQEQISIRLEEGNLLLSGTTAMALKYAVYQFLEKYLGCLWLSPNVEYIPKHSTIDLPTDLSYQYKPQIQVRTVHSQLFYSHTDFAEKHKVSTEAFPFYIEGVKVHTFALFVPEESFYQSHPEYFALRGDRRLPAQLCLSNPEVFSIVKSHVAELFQSHPESSVISVSQNDNQQYCQCKACKQIDLEEGSPSGSMIRFVNRIAENFPRKTISTLAYQYTRRPCKTKPASNVLITLCTIECDRSAPIQQKCQEFVRDLEGWGKLTKNIRIWDYTTQFTNFLAPFPNLRTLKPNIDLFKKNGARWVFEQHSHGPSDLFELRSYVMAKLLWDSERELDELLLEFTNAYYQEAGKYIKKYIDSMENNLSNDKDFFLYLYGDPSQAFESFLAPERMKEYSAMFEQAQNAVRDKPEILDRIKLARIGLDYASLEMYRKHCSKDYQLLLSGSDTVNSQFTDTLKRFTSVCQQNHITLINEMGYTVDEYCSYYRLILSRSVIPNKGLHKPIISLTPPGKYANGDPSILNDGIFGGGSFFSDWLGYEGEDMEVIIDLESLQNIRYAQVSFLQVSNHVVFFPEEVSFLASADRENYTLLATAKNAKPLKRKGKVHDFQIFEAKFTLTKQRFIKIKAKNMKTPPYWHHAAGQPAWIFADEIIIH